MFSRSRSSRNDHIVGTSHCGKTSFVREPRQTQAQILVAKGVGCCACARQTAGLAGNH